MGSPSIPAQPAPPDYAAANREAITTDISNLPLRRQIDAAARLGQSVTYTDPVTGQQKTADFTGTGDQTYATQMAQLAGQTNADIQRQQLALRQELGTQNAAQTAREIQAADPQGYALRQAITNRTSAELGMGPATVGPSQDIANAQQRLTTMAGAVPQADGSVRGLADQLGGRDNRANALLDAAGQQDNRTSALLGAAGQQDNRTAALINQTAAQRDGRINDIYSEAQRLPGQASDPTTQGLNAGLAQAYSDYQLGGKLSDSERRQVMDDARAGQAARGNYLGDAAAVAEAMDLGTAANARAQQRLGNLLDIQNRAFSQNDTLRNETSQNALNRVNTLASIQGQDVGQRQTQTAQLGNLIGQDVNQRQAQIGQMGNLIGQDVSQRQNQISQMSGLVGQDVSQNSARVGQLASLYGQDFGQQQASYGQGLQAAQAAYQGAQGLAGEQRASRQEGFGYDQQRLANANQVALGAPITNQFGSLGGAQNGAVGYTPVNFQGGATTNPNAGAQGASFAQGLYGTQAGIWGQSANIAAQGNPWMSLVGNAAGAAAGAAI